MWIIYDAVGRQQVSNLASSGYFSILNVKDYGAVGDGSTNDTTAIQSAISAAIAGGVSSRGVDLYFPAGVYATNAALTCVGNNVMFRGSGWQSTIIYASHTTGDIITFGDGTTHSGCGLMDMSVWCSAARTAGNSININLVNDFFIENFVINNCFTGILVQGASIKVTINHGEINNIHVTDGIGISINNGAAGDTYISNIVMSNAPASKPLAGIQITATGHTSIIRCNTTSCNYGLYVIPTGTQLVTYLFIDHTLFDSCGVAGAYFFASGASTAKIQSVMCVDSWFSGSTANYGIQINLANSAIVDALSFIGCRILNNFQHGVLLSAGVNISFTDCTIAGNGQNTTNTYDGINIAAGVSSISVVNCKIGQAGTAANQQRYAINVAAGASAGLQFIANDCQPNGTVGSNGYINLGALTGGGNQIRDNIPTASNGMNTSAPAATGAINTTQTYITGALKMMANSVRVGTTFRFVICGTNTSTVANASTFRVHFGTAGTTADTAILTAAVTSAASGTTIPFRVVIEITCRTVGASASFIGFMTVENTGTTGIAAVNTTVVSGTMATGVTTNANFIGVSYVSAATTTTSTFQFTTSEVIVG